MDIVASAKKVVTEHCRLVHEREGVLLANVTDAASGISLAKEVLATIVNRKTALFLSGGSTPKALYEQIATEETLQPGVVGLIDERYGQPYHDQSNEKMILQTGLVRYLSARDIPYYTILRGLPLKETAGRYDELFRSLQSVYQQVIGVLGIGKDGHTSSIAPTRSDFSNPMFAKEQTTDMIGYLDDVNGPYKKRVGMTFLGLAMFDVLLILAFGKEKEDALTKMFDTGSEEEIPARFFTRKDIASKTILLTDNETI